MAGDDEIQNDGWLRATRYVLILSGVGYVLLIPLGPLIAASKFHDPHMPSGFNLGFTIGFSIVMLVICGGLAGLNFAAAWGLARGRKWAWVMGIVLGGLYAPSICMPLGGVVLYGLLRDKVRRRFMDGVAPSPAG